MSQFDHYDGLLNESIFDFFGNPCVIKPGPLNRNPAPVETVATIDVERVEDNAGNVISEVIVVEYPRAAWPNPRRGDLIEMDQQTWQVTNKRDATELTQIVEVAQHG